MKSALVSGKYSDGEIVTFCAIGNPKRMYFLKQEVKGVSVSSLAKSLSVLFELEVAIKSGATSDLILPSLLRITQLVNL